MSSITRPITDAQQRAWLQGKLENYIWKIKDKNSYGSLKKVITISKDLHKILNEFDEMINEVKK